MIGRNGERRSGISAQTARHDDDDDVAICYLFIERINRRESDLNSTGPKISFFPRFLQS